VHARLVACRLRGPASILIGPRHPGGLPVLVHVVSQRAQVLRLRRANGPLAIYRSPSYCLPLSPDGRRPELDFSKLNHPAHRCPCLRFG